jgi:hypothetical protein
MSRVKRMPPAKIRTYHVGCPYCPSNLPIDVREFPLQGGGHLRIHACPECSGRGEWHEGAFAFSIYRLLGARTGGVGEKGPSLLELRVMGVEGERELAFETGANPVLRPGDTISLSYPRISTGVFRKKWTGENSSTPAALWNNTTQQGWRL